MRLPLMARLALRFHSRRQQSWTYAVDPKVVADVSVGTALTFHSMSIRRTDIKQGLSCMEIEEFGAWSEGCPNAEAEGVMNASGVVQKSAGF